MNRNKENRSLFLASTKMADVIITNYGLLSILPRFKMRLGFGDKSVSEVCHEQGADEQLFLLVCNVYTFEDYLPKPIDLLTLDVNSLVDYLYVSHGYYRDEKIAGIESMLSAMSKSFYGKQHDILLRFFDEYKREVLNHFEYEEKIVFTYVVSLIKGEVYSGFTISQYEDNHGNIEDKLSDLKNIIIKYLPQEYSSKERLEVLTEICIFEEDLTKHALIEDRILVPFVEHIEQSL